MKFLQNPGPARLSLLGAALVLVSAAGLAPARPSAAQTEDGQQKQKFGETVITADNIDYDLGKKQVIADGHVELVSGNSRMTSEKMTVQMTQGRELDWAKCEGKVFVEKKNPEDGTGMEARGQTLDYSETNQTAVLTGGVTAHLLSPRLSKPAVVTGSRIDMDLKASRNVVHRSPEAQAKVHVEPKGDEKNTMPEPLDLMGDQIEMNSETQEYIATGKPVMQKPTSKLQARVIRFTVEKATNDVKMAYAEKDVIFDGQGENGSILHATGDNGVFDRDSHDIVITGMIHATQKEPGDDRPTIYEGGKFTYNTESRKSRLSGPNAKVIVPDSKTMRKPSDAEKKGDEKKPGDGEKKPEAEKKPEPKKDGAAPEKK